MAWDIDGETNADWELDTHRWIAWQIWTNDIFLHLKARSKSQTSFRRWALNRRSSSWETICILRDYWESIGTFLNKEQTRKKTVNNKVHKQLYNAHYFIRSNSNYSIIELGAEFRQRIYSISTDGVSALNFIIPSFTGAVRETVTATNQSIISKFRE